MPNIVVVRRNHVTVVGRGAFTKRGSAYTNMACTIRCVRPDQTSQTVTLHYLNDGTCNLRFLIRKQEYFIPIVVLMKALINTTDRDIYERIVQVRCVVLGYKMLMSETCRAIQTTLS